MNILLQVFWHFTKSFCVMYYNVNVFVFGPSVGVDQHMYMQNVNERFKKTCNSLGIQLPFKGSNTICTLIMAPKNKENMSEKWDNIPV